MTLILTSVPKIGSTSVFNVWSAVATKICEFATIPPTTSFSVPTLGPKILSTKASVSTS